MEIKATLSGMEKLFATLAEARKAGATAKGLGLKRAALLMRDTMVHYTEAGHPDHPEVQTGRLKASIRFEPTNPTDEVYIGSDADYAPHVEFGHSQEPGRFVAKLGKRLVAGSVKPYPFVRPAFTDVVDSGQALKLFEGAVKEVLKI